ncbi:hypothetical protein JNB11_07610 [Kocuria palustris]|nr:hypothetical protein [Kocuria palustris]
MRYIKLIIVEEAPHAAGNNGVEVHDAENTLRHTKHNISHIQRLPGQQFSRHAVVTPNPSAIDGSSLIALTVEKIRQPTRTAYVVDKTYSYRA